MNDSIFESGFAIWRERIGAVPATVALSSEEVFRIARAAYWNGIGGTVRAVVSGMKMVMDDKMDTEEFIRILLAMQEECLEASFPTEEQMRATLEANRGVDTEKLLRELRSAVSQLRGEERATGEEGVWIGCDSPLDAAEARFECALGALRAALVS